LILTAAFGNGFVRADLDVGIVATRTVNVNIKLVFIGISESDVDVQYMSWSENLPKTINTQVIIGGKDTGVTSNVRYYYSFVQDGFKEKLISFLGSVAETGTLRNPAFTYYEREGKSLIQKYLNVSSTHYDANRVETWLRQNGEGFGGLLPDGWTLVFMYLPELPSATYESMRKYRTQDSTKNTTDVHPHYYSTVAVDEDLEYRLRYRQFMTAYGNRGRLWFVDLSAGPSFWSWRETLPLQVALEDQKIRLGSTYGRNWLTEYLADYAWGAVMNFVIPFPVYYPSYTTRYNIVVNILDDRTDAERKNTPIERTVNETKIREAFSELAPYAKTDVQILVRKTEDLPALRRIVRDNFEKLEDATFQGSIDVIDLRPVYYYIQNNLASFVSPVKKDETEFTIPVFAFVFSEKSFFSYSYKWDRASRDPERPSLLGIALGDIVLISINQWYFTRGDEVGQKGKGIGLSQTIIHETGHMIGLMHPHQYDDLGDFSYSAMGYFTNDYGFGQSDKDFLRHAHADQVILQTATNLQKAKMKLESRVESNEVKASIVRLVDRLKLAESECDKLNYTEAVARALEAKQTSLDILSQAEKLPEATAPLKEQIQTFIPIAFVVGITVGVCVALVIVKATSRRKHTANPHIF